MILRAKKKAQRAASLAEYLNGNANKPVSKDKKAASSFRYLNTHAKVTLENKANLKTASSAKYRSWNSKGSLAEKKKKVKASRAAYMRKLHGSSSNSSKLNGNVWNDKHHSASDVSKKIMINCRKPQKYYCDSSTGL